MDVKSLSKYTEQIAKLEVKNLKIVADNFKAARKELASRLENKPDYFLGTEWQQGINEVVSELESNLKDQAIIATPYQVGLDFSKDSLAYSAKIPKNSAFFDFVPFFDLEMLSFIESEYSNLITQVADVFREQALRTVQTSLLLGNGTGTIMERLLGKGLQGVVGRDGIFRPARLRAEYIARTVTNDLENRGAYSGYRQFSATFPGLNIRKEWLTVSDNRTSKRCIDLKNQIALLEENFKADDGWEGPHPPSHVNCRSRVAANTDKWDDSLEQTAKDQSFLTKKETSGIITERLAKEKRTASKYKVSMDSELIRYK
jgi:hypothetical protein